MRLFVVIERKRKVMSEIVGFATSWPRAKELIPVCTWAAARRGPNDRWLSRSVGDPAAAPGNSPVDYVVEQYEVHGG